MLFDNQKQKLRKAFSSGALRVQSVSPSGTVEWKPVTRVHRLQVADDTIQESIHELRTKHGVSVVTGGHRIYVSPTETVDAETLRVGDQIALFNGAVGTEVGKVLGNRRLPSRQWMYDLTVEPHHNFILARTLCPGHNSPDRNYHFRPPTHEETISQYNKVFGFIWLDDELKEYLERALNTIELSPPLTPMGSLDVLATRWPSWKTLLITGAMIHALQALRINWIADEFSLDGCSVVSVLLPDGRQIALPIAELFASAHDNETLLETRHAIRSAFQQGLLTVQAVDASGQPGWFPIKDVLKHHVPHKKALRVTLEGGASVVVTEDHSLFAALPFAPIAASSLTVGSLVTTVRNRPGDSTWVCATAVSSIEIVPHTGEMYDLCVPGPENFVLTNGILAHNSYSIGGVSLDIDKSSKYEGAISTSSEQFDKQLEKAKATVNVIRGLQQPRYGIGIRSSFGPAVGRGVLSPRKFLGL